MDIQTEKYSSPDSRINQKGDTNYNGGNRRNYYFNLDKFIPILYSGRGIPFFLKHKQYVNALPCIAVINIIFILIIALHYLNADNIKPDEFTSQINKINILLLILIDISSFLVIFMNPGIVALQDIDTNEDTVFKYCQRCRRKITQEMKHCLQCYVCVQNLDHHCGFFGKCIAGRQRFAFYMFITFIFAGFLSLLAEISMVLGS